MFKFTSKTIAFLGVLVALSTVTNIFSINIIPNLFAINFNHTVNFLSGALFGPIFGFLSGILGDLIGCLIAPKGPYNVLITIASGLPGLLSGIAFLVYGKTVKRKNAINFIAFSVITYIFITAIVTCGLNTYALWSMYSKGKKTFWVYLSARAPFQVVVSAINMVLSIIIPIALKNSLFKNFFTKTVKVKESE